MGCSCKAVTWVVWVLHMVLCIAYSALALATFHNVDVVEIRGRTPETKKVEESYKTALLAACMLGFLIVVCWIILSFIVMLSNLIGDVSLAYGVMLGSAIGIACFQLLAGLVLQNASPTFERIWEGKKYQSYQATFALSYVMIVSFTITASFLLFGRNKTASKASTYSAGGGGGGRKEATTTYDNQMSAQV